MRRRKGFTLVEMLIVVAVLAVILGLVIPKMESAHRDAQRTMTYNHLHDLTTAIERYKLLHSGYAPDDLTGNTLAQLTSTTDEAGNLGSGPGYPFGPFIFGEIPENPINGSSVVVQATSVPPLSLGSKAGWIYDPETGQIWAGEQQTKRPLLPYKF